MPYSDITLLTSSMHRKKSSGEHGLATISTYTEMAVSSQAGFTTTTDKLVVRYCDQHGTLCVLVL